MRKIFFYTIIVLAVTSCKQIRKTESVSIENKTTDFSSVSAKFSVEILDEAAKSIINPAATISILASGFGWTEGPLWIEDGDYLLFSDIPNNKVYKLTNQKDTITYLNHSGFTGNDFKGSEPGSNGLLLNLQGELILMQHGDRMVSKMNSYLKNPTEDFIVLASEYRGKKLNSPNDGVFDKAGNLYFTDPPYGLPDRINDPSKELPFQGVYCLLTSGELVLVDGNLKYPNGIGISRDGKTLYVSASNPEKAAWYGYEIIAPGIAKNQTLLADATHLVDKPNHPGLPDGLKIHSSGTIFATGPGGIWIFNAHGNILARIHTGQKTANCAFSADEKILYMTADDYILSIPLL